MSSLDVEFEILGIARKRRWIFKDELIPTLSQKLEDCLIPESRINKGGNMQNFLKTVKDHFWGKESEFPKNLGRTRPIDCECLGYVVEIVKKDLEATE